MKKTIAILVAFILAATNVSAQLNTWYHKHIEADPLTETPAFDHHMYITENEGVSYADYKNGNYSVLLQYEAGIFDSKTLADGNKVVEVLIGFYTANGEFVNKTKFYFNVPEEDPGQCYIMGEAAEVLVSFLEGPGRVRFVVPVFRGHDFDITAPGRDL